MMRNKIKVCLIITGIAWVTVILGFYRNLNRKQNELEKRTAASLHRSEMEIEFQCNGEHVTIFDKSCVRRFKFVKENWKNKSCFIELGISDKDEETLNCSILRYLKYVERLCPHMANSMELFKKLMPYKNQNEILEADEVESAVYRTKMTELISKLKICGRVCLWMKQRILSMEKHFVEALKMHKTNQGENKKRRKLTILIHMGLLTKEYGLNFGEGAFSGGPLGELVQWSDLILTLYILGHNVLLSWSPDVLKNIVNPNVYDYNDCKRTRVADLIYTDIVGLEQLRHSLGTIYHYRCLLRILDVYGTEPEYNHPQYHKKTNAGQTWGGKGLNPRQFLTQFPHTPDNSFLGFVVVEGSPLSTEEKEGSEGKALIYGKRPEILYGLNKIKFLNSLPKFFSETHATILQKSTHKEEDQKLPDFIINHGPLPQDEFAKILRRSHIYIGVGVPFEGPAALEAIANGVTYLNPKFDPPKLAYERKPTNRKLTSQNPYAEVFIGEPHVYTIDIKNMEIVHEILKKISTSPRPKPEVPVEFTALGFIERVNAYIQQQDFCEGDIQVDINTGKIWERDNKLWPSLDHMEVKISNKEETCTHACMRHEMVCEREYFSSINTEAEIKKYEYTCNLLKYVGKNHDEEIGRMPGNTKYLVPQCHAPSVDTFHSECTIQTDKLLFSCACTPPSGYVRLCPCRKYKKEQIALSEE